jgi:hypothetical protein
MFRRYISYPYLILVLAPFVLFSPILLTRKALFWGTSSTQFIPWWQTAWETLLQGHLPLWNPWLGMGAPLLANYQSALLYPPTWIYLVFWLIGGISMMAWGMTLLVVIHLIWASLGMALLVRQLGFGILSQVVSGLAFGLSGYLVARAGFLSINSATAWIPWIILGTTWLVEALIQSQKIQISRLDNEERFTSGNPKKVWKVCLTLGICTCMLLLSGHAQTAWYSLVFTGVWGLFWLDFAHRRESGTGPSIKFLLNYGLIFLGTILFGFFLAAVQIIPTAEYLLQSQRSAAVEFDYAMNYSFWPWRWLTLIAPTLFGSPVSGDYWGYGNYWEDAIYIGLSPLVLALWFSSAQSSLPRLIISWIVILVCSLLGLGRNTPYSRGYTGIFQLDMFRPNPQTWV